MSKILNQKEETNSANFLFLLAAKIPYAAKGQH